MGGIGLGAGDELCPQSPRLCFDKGAKSLRERQAQEAAGSLENVLSDMVAASYIQLKGHLNLCRLKHSVSPVTLAASPPSQEVLLGCATPGSHWVATSLL